MKRTRIRLTILFALTTFALTFARCVGLAFEGQETLDAPQFRAAFETPPPGYGEVPFWWWTGEKLDPDRLKAQVLELSRKGIPGVQVNYAHQDVRNAVQPNWLTYPNDPEVFTDEWFDVFEDVASYCNELKMGIGLSGYTLDWQHSPGNLFDRLLYSDPKLQSRDLYVSQRVDLSPGEPYGATLVKNPDLAQSPNDDQDELVQVVAYPVAEDGRLVAEESRALGRDLNALRANDEKVERQTQVWFYRAKRAPHTLNPLYKECGAQVVARFFQPFEERAKERLGGDDGGNLGLNYFFQDELQLGTGERVWSDDVADEFEARKGYSYWSATPALFDAKVGDLAEKYRLDFLDVRVRLAEERYFEPIYNWHASRGRIYACDPGSRGRDPSEFCDYFSAIRWYTAPGHDTPGGRADFIKNKVSASIAHFYKRPRVWLEGYHSFGWHASPERLLFATNENYLFGANLLNLHGLYYTTYGGFWEWAPPCYHFRQPYWETFGSFLKYFERLSYALTRGVEQSDVVILYPVSPYQSRLNGGRARDVAFEAARRVYESGREVLFIDDDSIARAEVADGRLCVAGGKHQVLILPSIQGIRWSTLVKASELRRAGGVVIALDAPPIASDRAGRNDDMLTSTVLELFGKTPDELTKVGESRSEAPSGGLGLFLSGRPDAQDSSSSIKYGTNETPSYLREYPGGFAGRWVWSPELAKTVYFKWVATGLTDVRKEYDARFFCDNSGSLYVNGTAICNGADYNNGWQGKLSLRNGDVVTIDGVDSDSPRRGSAGMFFALATSGKTLATSEDFRYSLVPPKDARVWRTEPDEFDSLASSDVGNVHVLHRTGVNSELGGAAPVQSNDESMWRRFASALEPIVREVYNADTNAPCVAMKRETADATLFFVMRGAKDAKLSFNALGRAELFDAWTGVSRVLPTTHDASGRSTLTWPYNASEAGLVVFWKGLEPAVEPSEPPLAREPRRIALDGEWSFELIPTLDNRWGDFRLPADASEPTLGAEAQRFDVLDADGAVSRSQLNDFGVKFMLLGPVPAEAPLDDLEARLARLERVDPKTPVRVGDKDYFWRPYAFSWRWGIEGNPGRQGYHGLKEKIDSRFIGLGKETNGFNETVFSAEEAGSVYYLWSTVTLSCEAKEGDERVDCYAGGGAPTTVYLGGKRLDFSASLNLTLGRPVPILVRYDGAGRRSLAWIRRGDNSQDASRLIEANGQDSGAYNGLSTGLRNEKFEGFEYEPTPLSTVWFDLPGVLDYDVYGTEDRENITRLRFTAPPGLSGMTIPTYGELKNVTVDGREVSFARDTKLIAGKDFWRGKRDVATATSAPSCGAFSDRPTRIETVRFAAPFARACEIELSLKCPAGVYGASACPEPIRMTTARGVTTLGDWSRCGVLANYSGGARYEKSFELSSDEVGKARVYLALGKVGVSCRVRVNDHVVGELHSSPWRLDITGAVRAGANTATIDVYNTLGNFYRNIPTRYNGGVDSGLIGPVELEVK